MEVTKELMDQIQTKKQHMIDSLAKIETVIEFYQSECSHENVIHTSGHNSTFVQCQVCGLQWEE